MIYEIIYKKKLETLQVDIIIHIFNDLRQAIIFF